MSTLDVIVLNLKVWLFLDKLTDLFKLSGFLEVLDLLLVLMTLERGF